MLAFKPLSLLISFCIFLTLSAAFPVADPPPYETASSISSKSKRVDGDGDTPMKDADEKLPPPGSGSGPSYADWMKNLYDMGGGKKVRRDDLNRYKTTVSEEELDAWRLAAQGPHGFGRVIGD